MRRPGGQAAGSYLRAMWVVARKKSADPACQTSQNEYGGEGKGVREVDAKRRYARAAAPRAWAVPAAFTLALDMKRALTHSMAERRRETTPPRQSAAHATLSVSLLIPSPKYSAAADSGRRIKWAPFVSC